jgi:PAS domain S-box-containing protein
MLVREYEQMQEWKDQLALALLDEELHQLIGAIFEIPYSASPLERPEVICFTRRVEELTGYTADQILADRQLWMNIIHPDDRDRVFAALAKCKDMGIPFEIEYRIIHKCGLIHYVIDKGEPVFNDEGQVIQIDGTITNIGEYRKARICVCQKKPEVTKLNSVNSSVFHKV